MISRVHDLRVDGLIRRCIRSSGFNFRRPELELDVQPLLPGAGDANLAHLANAPLGSEVDVADGRREEFHGDFVVGHAGGAQVGLLGFVAGGKLVADLTR